MSSSPFSQWKVPEPMQPQPQDYGYDLDRALAAVVGLRARVPADALTADSLGTERAGNGVLIRASGLVLTIGYLVTEAESVWLTLIDGRVVPGDVLAYDQETGFGLVQALARLDVPALDLGDSGAAMVGQRVVVAGAGGREHAVVARIAAKQEFAGYWEYALDEALFTAPAHPHWGGAALIGHDGELLGVGSLQLEQGRGPDKSEHLNMIVPIDLLKPILDDLLAYGRPNRPPRPWLGLFATEVEDRVVVVGLANRGPAERADLRTGDVVLAVGDNEVSDLSGLFHRIWALGAAGVEVPLVIYRDGRTLRLKVPSADRTGLFKAPRLQ
jgi:S1-C subfamily serine protease